MSDCIFCKIAAKELPAQFIKETPNLIVIKDLHPQAEHHYLIIPKKHLVDIREFSKDDMPLAAEIFAVAQDLSKDLPEPGDFKLVVNNGHSAGQRVFHTHFHFLSGKNMPIF